MTFASKIRRLGHEQLTRTGSTRSAGILRIALASLGMAKWAQTVTADQVLSPHWLIAFGAVFITSLFFMLIGFYSRIATGVAAVGALSIAFGINSWAGWISASFSHHEACLAVSIAMLALQPNGGSYSLDRWLAVRRAENAGLPVPPERGDLWAWPLMGIALSCVYFYGAMVKMKMGYINGDRLEMILMSKYLGSELPKHAFFQALMPISAVGSIVLELLLTFGLWFRRTRWPLVITGTIFHLVIYETMTVYTFSLTMIFMYLAFFPVDEVHRELDRMHGPVPPSPIRPSDITTD